MQRTTACSLSYFQLISRLRDLPKQVFGISCGEKCDCASPKRSKRPPMQEKVRSCEFFTSQDSHNRTFLCSGGAFSRSEPGSQGRGDPKRPFRNPRLAKPPAGTPADASPGYVPQTYLTGASYERALRKREGKAQLARRAKANRTPRGSIPWPSSRGRTMRPARSEEAFSSPALPGKTGRTQ